MRQTTDAGRLRELYYRCQFRELVETAEAMAAAQRTTEVELLVANACFELSDAQGARLALDRATKDSKANEALRLHALARMSYMTDGSEQARDIWTELYGRFKDPVSRFRALLGIANTFYDEKDWDQIPSLIKEMAQMDLSERLDDQICFLHLKGNYLMASGRDLRTARECFEKALALSGPRAWTYWTVRSLYGLARSAKARESTSELKWTLKVLKSFLDPKEAVYLHHMVQSAFSEVLRSDERVQFDSENLRLVIEDKWINFYDRPKLYQFLELLHKSQRFVTKQQIAETLWPREPYKKGMHDPRIFDIAKRVRAIFEESAMDPLCLKSGRMGYRLVWAA